jgi:hypothetical protein
MGGVDRTRRHCEAVAVSGTGHLASAIRKDMQRPDA